MKLEAGVRIERLTLDFIGILDLWMQQLVDYSSAIALLDHCTFSRHLLAILLALLPAEVFISANRRQPLSKVSLITCSPSWR